MDRFTDAYIACLLWSESDNDTGDSWDTLGYVEADIDDQSVSMIVLQCAAFQQDNADLLALWNDDGDAGHNFCLTRNRHGAGFWDRGAGTLGTALTAASHAWGETELYRGDDGRLYVGGY